MLNNEMKSKLWNELMTFEYTCTVNLGNEYLPVCVACTPRIYINRLVAIPAVRVASGPKTRSGNS